MVTEETETKISRDLKFCELNQSQQIEKLRYELQIALRAISHLGNKITTIQNHQHNLNGEVLVSPNRIDRVFQSDRSGFLN